MRLPRCVALTLLSVALLDGCQPAERYGPRPGSETSAKKQTETDAPKKTDYESLDPEIQWIEVVEPPRPDVSIEFVHAEKEEWAKLPKFWNASPLTEAGRAGAVVGMPPLTVGAVAGSSVGVIKIKVPLGLPDPSAYVPAENPLTLGKWKLGQRLFFDDTWLESKVGTSCASCHRPDHGFADHERRRDGFNTPTLVNCVFNRWQFWDGRAGRLEEVVQRTLEDERESDTPKPFRHTWSGVIHRLRDKPAYHEPFNAVFGKPIAEKENKEQTNITQDTVGRALACYLRTILAGDSIHDRALREQTRKHDSVLKAEHYEAVLDDAALVELGRAEAKKADVAAELMRGYLLFHVRDDNRPLMNCYRCHSGQTFHDNKFHNLGVGSPSRPGQEGGRFAQVPIGQKDRYLIDAYKTPTLRNLLRTGPYFHDGSKISLREVVEFYNRGAERNSHLDPELRGKDDGTRLLYLSAAEIDAVVLFLSALNGGDVDSTLTPRP
jgi:cytochrome c peroxidase